MTFQEAADWFQSHGGQIVKSGHTAEVIYFRAQVGPHRSENHGIEHNGRVNIPMSDPEFQRLFVKLVEEVRPRVEAYEASHGK